VATVTTQWITELVDGISDPVKEITSAGREAADAIDEISNSANGANNEIRKLSAMDLKATADAIRDLTGQFESLMQPGLAFEAQMKEMQSITRSTNEEMEAFGESARRTAKAYGNDAASQLESYSALIARFGPRVASDSAALAVMGENIAILSKLMRGDAVGAMDALTTAMLQFGVDVNNPQAAAAEMTRMMHVMAAAGNEGASEVIDTAEALKNAGVASKNAHLSFEETNAALQALAQGGRVGAEAGVSLRNVLGKMGGIDIIPRRAQKKLQQLGIDYSIVSDKSRSFVERLRELRKAQGDATLIAQIFGIENEAAANILLNSIDAQEEMTGAITGTNAANESAAIIMESGAEKLARYDAWLNDLKISFYEVAGGILPFVVGLGTIAFTIANIAAAATGIKTLITFIRGLTIAQWALNAAFWANPLTWIIAGIMALVAAIALAWSKFEGFRKVIYGVWETIKGFGNILKTFVIDRIKGIISGLGSLGKAISRLFKGDFSGAWEAAKEGAADISGYAAAKSAAQSMGDLKGAYQVGAMKGEESWKASQEKKENKPLGPLQSFQLQPVTGDPGSGTSGKTKPGTGTSTGKLGVSGLTRSGSGSGKTINMTVNNYFTGFKGTKEMAEEVARAVNNRLSDSLATV